MNQQEDQENACAIAGWNTIPAIDNSWIDGTKTANDPCPSGFRVPTLTEFQGVIDNNTMTSLGTWSNDLTNYSSGILFGDSLFLPATGGRHYSNGSLNFRGIYGGYWFSTQSMGSRAYNLYFGSDFVTIYTNERPVGFPVRCISETSTTLLLKTLTKIKI